MAKCKECENKIEVCEDCGRPIFPSKPKQPYWGQKENDLKHFCNVCPKCK